MRATWRRPDGAATVRGMTAAARGPDRATPRPLPARLMRLFDEGMTARRAAQVIAAVTAILVVAAGVVMHFVERSMFPNVWIGMWWAVQTVTSVGYGDVVPRSLAGRLLGLFVMINGIAFLTVVIATISAAFVEGARRRYSEAHALDDDPVLGELRRISARLDQIEQRLDGAAPSDEPAPKPR
jgi:voltage-gated potassium channel